MLRDGIKKFENLLKSEENSDEHPMLINTKLTSGEIGASLVTLLATLDFLYILRSLKKVGIMIVFKLKYHEYLEQKDPD